VRLRQREAEEKEAEKQAKRAKEDFDKAWAVRGSGLMGGPGFRQDR
jgi:hypothetical protein